MQDVKPLFWSLHTYQKRIPARPAAFKIDGYDSCVRVVDVSERNFHIPVPTVVAKLVWTAWNQGIMSSWDVTYIC